jgi:hypothetical protein
MVDPVAAAAAAAVAVCARPPLFAHERNTAPFLFFFLIIPFYSALWLLFRDCFVDGRCDSLC